MKKRVTNHQEILELAKTETSGLYQISTELADEKLKEMGYNLSASYFYESERGDEKEIYVYEKEGKRIVKINNYIEREGGMFVHSTFVPSDLAQSEYKAKIEMELENPSIWLISSILNKRKITPAGNDNFMDFSGSMNCHHFSLIINDNKLCDKILNKFKELVLSDNYHSENPYILSKVRSILDKI